MLSHCGEGQSEFNGNLLVSSDPSFLFLIHQPSTSALDWSYSAMTHPIHIYSGDPHCVRADCLATNTEYCDRCTHAATQATNVARIKTEGTKGLLQGQVAG
jgi:hypothetical protein